MNAFVDGGGADITTTGDAAAARRSFVRFRLVLVLGVTLLFAGIGFSTWRDISSSRAATIDGALHHARRLVGSLGMHASATFRVADMAALAMAQAMEENYLRRPVSSAYMVDMIKRLINDDSPYRNLVVTDPYGKVVFDNTGISHDFNVSDREFFYIHRERPDTGMFVSGLIRSRLGHGWFVAVSRRVNKPDGGFGGVAYAVVDLSYFERYYQQIDVGDFGFVTLWASGGEVLVRVPRDQKLIENPSAYAERISGKRDGEVVPEIRAVSPVDGVERWIIARPVGGLPLRVSIGIAGRDVLAAWESAAPRQIMVAALTALLVFVLAAALIIHLGRLEAATGAWRESEKRFRALFDSTFGFICLVMPDGRVASVNRAMEELAACPCAEQEGQAIWTLIPWSRSPTAMRQMRDGVRRASLGEFVRFESELTGANGSLAVDISIKPLRDDGGLATSLIVEARDITDRKRVEDHLRASETRVRSYFEAAMEGIVVANRAGRFVDVNPAACRILGYDRQTLLDMTMAQLLPDSGDPGRMAAAHIKKVMDVGSHRGELGLRRSDGGERITELSAARLDGDLYLGVFRDVTERRDNVKALIGSNARFAALIRAIPDLVFLVDTDHRYVEEVSPLVGSSRHGLPLPKQGEGPHDFLPGPTADLVTRAMDDALGSQKVVSIEFPITRVDGEGRWLEARFSPMPEKLGPVRLLLVMIRDITGRVEAAERLALAKEQAETANRTKSAFLATMSHELRTPLNAILGFSEIMRSEMFGPVGNARYQGYMDNIHESGAHLLALINDVLDVSKLEAGKYFLEEGAVDIPALVDSCRAFNEEAARQGDLVFTCVVEEGLPSLFADERASRQILLNLISNAIKFTPSGGEVRVRAERHEGGGLAIIVSDTGIGIPSEAMGRIAKPFQQVDSSIARRYGGTGLGLAIVRNLIELHGGRLEMASTEGTGTTMTAIFPPIRLHISA